MSEPEALLAAVRLFYFIASLSMLIIWASLSLKSGGDFHRKCLRCPLVVRPTWMPISVLLPLHRPDVYLGLCRAAPAGPLLAALFPGSSILRFVAAVLLSLYHCVEFSANHSHGHFANLCTAWGLVLLPDHLAQGLGLGIAVHAISASGLLKAYIRGLDCWREPGPMCSILRDDGSESLPQSGPVSQALVLLSGSKFLFECFIIPASMLLAPSMRFWMIFGAIAMHTGIAVLVSFWTGVAFLPNLATYMFGFGWITGVGAARFSTAWFCAVAMFLGAAVWPIFRFRRISPEDWPSSPLAFFAWSGQQWDALLDCYQTGNTRLVLSTHRCPPDSMVGRTIVGLHGRACSSSGKGSAVVFDAWQQVGGEMLVHSPLLPLFDWTGSVTPVSAVTAAEAWLQREKLLVEIKTGLPIMYAYFVRTTGGKACEVAEVIHCSQGVSASSDDGFAKKLQNRFLEWEPHNKVSLEIEATDDRVLKKLSSQTAMCGALVGSFAGTMIGWTFGYVTGVPLLGKMGGGLAGLLAGSALFSHILPDKADSSAQAAGSRAQTRSTDDLIFQLISGERDSASENCIPEAKELDHSCPQGQERREPHQRVASKKKSVVFADADPSVRDFEVEDDADARTCTMAESSLVESVASDSEFGLGSECTDAMNSNARTQTLTGNSRASGRDSDLGLSQVQLGHLSQFEVPHPENGESKYDIVSGSVETYESEASPTATRVMRMSMASSCGQRDSVTSDSAFGLGSAAIEGFHSWNAQKERSMSIASRASECSDADFGLGDSQITSLHLPNFPEGANDQSNSSCCAAPEEDYWQAEAQVASIREEAYQQYGGEDDEEEKFIAHQETWQRQQEEAAALQSREDEQLSTKCEDTPLLPTREEHCVKEEQAEHWQEEQQRLKKDQQRQDMQKVHRFLADNDFSGVNSKRTKMSMLRLIHKYPLHAAVKTRDAEMVRCLLSMRADPTLTDSHGDAPKEYAQRMNNEGSHEAVRAALS